MQGGLGRVCDGRMEGWEGCPRSKARIGEGAVSGKIHGGDGKGVQGIQESGASREDGQLCNMGCRGHGRV